MTVGSSPGGVGLTITNWNAAAESMRSLHLTTICRPHSCGLGAKFTVLDTWHRMLVTWLRYQVVIRRIGLPWLWDSCVKCSRKHARLDVKMSATGCCTASGPGGDGEFPWELLSCAQCSGETWLSICASCGCTSVVSALGLAMVCPMGNCINWISSDWFHVASSLRIRISFGIIPTWVKSVCTDWFRSSTVLVTSVLGSMSSSRFHGLSTQSLKHCSWTWNCTKSSSYSP